MSDSDSKEKDIKELSASIEKDLDNGEYLKDEDNEKIKYEQLKKLKEIQKTKKKEKKEVKSEEVEKPKSSNKSGISSLLKENIILIVLFLLIAHPKFSQIIGKYIPFIKDGENGPSIISLLVKAVIFAVIFFIIKIFV